MKESRKERSKEKSRKETKKEKQIHYWIQLTILKFIQKNKLKYFNTWKYYLKKVNIDWIFHILENITKYKLNDRGLAKKLNMLNNQSQEIPK